MVHAVQTVAEARGIPMAQIALAWLTRQSPVAMPIVGASKDWHIDDAVRGIELKLTDDELARLDTNAPSRSVGF